VAISLIPVTVIFHRRPWNPNAAPPRRSASVRFLTSHNTRTSTGSTCGRPSNPVEAPFAAVRLRTVAAKRFKKVDIATAVIWKTLLIAEKAFCRLDAPRAAGRRGQRRRVRQRRVCCEPRRKEGCRLISFTQQLRDLRPVRQTTNPSLLRPSCIEQHYWTRRLDGAARPPVPLPPVPLPPVALPPELGSYPKWLTRTL
jgi:hypothetical protein